MLWLSIHIVWLIGFQNRLLVLVRWAWSFATRGRSNRLITGASARTNATDPEPVGVLLLLDPGSGRPTHRGLDVTDTIGAYRYRQGELLMPAGKPNILVIWGDDIGITNLSCYSDGLMGYRTPNIDRIATEGMRFTDSYGEQSCTAGRASFITGQSVYRTGMSKVGVPGVDIGLSAEDPTIAELLKPLGYATGQFGKNHLGDLNKYLPTVHGFDEFFGNLYHLNAEEEPELPDYPEEGRVPAPVRAGPPAWRHPFMGHG